VRRPEILGEQSVRPVVRREGAVEGGGEALSRREKERAGLAARSLIVQFRAVFRGRARIVQVQSHRSRRRRRSVSEYLNI